MKHSRAFGCPLAIVAVVTAYLLFASSAFGAIGNIPDSPLVTDPESSVNVFAVAGSTLYIGGTFDRIGNRTGGFVSVTGDTGALEPGKLPIVTGGDGLSAMISDGAGGWYIGGSFTHVGGVARTGLAHVLADGSVDPGFQADLSANSSIAHMALSGSTLYVSGTFTTIGGQSRANLAALNATTGAVSSWQPDPDGFVDTVAVSGDGSTLYVGGGFSHIGHTPASRAGLAAVDTTSGEATSWDPNPDGTVLALAVDGTTIYVGGQFSNIGATPAARHGLAAIKAADGNPTSWDPEPTSTPDPTVSEVDALVVSGSTVYVGGFFDHIGQSSSVARGSVAAVSASTGDPTGWNPNPDSGVNFIALSGSTVYLSGDFTHIGQTTRVARNFGAAVDATTGEATAWNPDPNSENLGPIGISGSDVVLSGEFTSLGGFDRTGLAAVDLTTGQVTPWNPDLGPECCADIASLAVLGSTVYVGGGFDHVDGQPRQNLAALDGTSGAVLPWNPGADFGPSSMAAAGGSLFVAGPFTQIGANSASRAGLAALDPTTGDATGFNPQPDSNVSALAVSGSTLYVTGEFTHVGVNARHHGAAFDIGTGALTGWDPDTDNFDVAGLDVVGSTIYLSGDFDHVHGVARNSLAAVNDTTGAPTSWNPSLDSEATGIGVVGGTVYVNGFFHTANGQTRKGLAAFDASSAALTSWDPNTGSDLDPGPVLAGPGGSLFVGGGFTSLDQSPNSGLALWGIPLPGASPEPPPPAPGHAATKPHLRVSFKHRQHILKQRGLILSAVSDQNGTLRFTATVSVPKLAKVLRFKSVRKTVKAGKRVKVKLKLSKHNLALIRRALNHHKRLTAKARVRDTSTAHLSANRTLKIRLVR